MTSSRESLGDRVHQLSGGQMNAQQQSAMHKLFVAGI